MHTVLITLLVLYFSGNLACSCRSAPRMSRLEWRWEREAIERASSEARRRAALNEAAGIYQYKPPKPPPPPSATLGEILSVLVVCLPLIVVVVGVVFRFLMGRS
jgi:hypothetical protein